MLVKGVWISGFDVWIYDIIVFYSNNNITLPIGKCVDILYMCALFCLAVILHDVRR